MLAIRFLATGETYRSLSLQFRVSERAISYIIDEVTKAIVQYIWKDYIKISSTLEDWLKISGTFQSRWNFPNCLGAINGKYIQIRPPPGTGSKYFNYKKTFSIILLAIAGPDYECIYVDIGSNGWMNDTGVWSSSDLREKLKDDCLNIPAPTPLPLGYISILYVFLGDDALALKSYVIKPYPQANLTPEKRVYNYHYSRARRISENLFGIVVNKWRILQQPLNLSPEKARTITTCSLVLHNFLQKSLSKNDYTLAGFVDSVNSKGELVRGCWRSKKGNSLGVFSFSIVSQLGRKAPKNSKVIRDIFAEYFTNEGSVEWQWDKAWTDREMGFWTIFI